MIARDLTGQRFGTLVVLRRAPSRPNRTMWLTRCDCKHEEPSVAALLVSGKKWRCSTCRYTAMLGHAARVSWARRGRCSWDGKPTSERKPFECAACSRTAVRNGRDAEGRPLGGAGAHVPRMDPAAPCVVCELPIGRGRFKTCSDVCSRENARRGDVQRNLRNRRRA